MKFMFSGIIYTFSKKESEDVTAELQSRGIKAGCYHADMSAQQRSYVHRNWLCNKIQVSFISSPEPKAHKVSL